MQIKNIVETCLYASDLKKAEWFYSEVLKLEPVVSEENRHVFFRCGGGMLLIFNPDHTKQEKTFMNGDLVPLHGCKGPGHVAFGIDPEEYDLWKERLVKLTIEIESEVTWPNGYKSLYFRDPANNSLELTTPALWEK